MINSIMITGGSGKVGFQLVKYYLNKKYQVITTSRDKDNILEKLTDFSFDPSLLHIVEVDFADKHALEVIENYIIDNSISIHSIIHNARNVNYLKIQKDGTVSKFNFNGELFIGVVFPYQLSILIVKLNVGLKNIIFVSSMYGVVGPNPTLYDDFHNQSPIHYGVAKAAQIHLVKELAIRLANKIRVNCVSFGGIKGRVDDDFLARYKALNPQNRMLEEQDVLAPLNFLVSDSSENMTGQNLIIDNGWTLW
jgi:NAD(P)-dependent dehydrogenase (short-subunit alcohol dehydrogenase family)